jgi:2-dehydro-3-deoxygalactonokinase
MSKGIAAVVADWGTTNLRAWAMAADGTIVDQRSGGRGLLAVEGGRFAEALSDICADWLAGADSVRGAGRPAVVMSGMVGSKLGWREVPYLAAPVRLDELARHLYRIASFTDAAVWIVPGISRDDPAQPEVMRGEEAQILGALQILGTDDGMFLLPGTHAKWAIVEGRRLVDFRTYMTGELYGLLRRSGTLSQLMPAPADGEVRDADAFRRGVERVRSPDAGNLLHGLFGVRTLGLFDRLPRAGLASYMSGLMIGAEIEDGRRWLRSKGKTDAAMAIGSPDVVAAYGMAASLLGFELRALDNAVVLPSALLSIARAAGLLGHASGDEVKR